MELTKTIQYYFHQPSLESVTLAELEQLVRAYPYCGPLQYLLLRKMKGNHAAGYPDQWQKSLLFFQDPYFLQAQVNWVHNPVKETVQEEEKPASPAPPIQSKLVKELTSELADALALAKSIAHAATEPETITSQETDEAGSLTTAPLLRNELLQKESPIRIPSIRDLGPVTDDMPSFEPYHTIDYFASQGIKLSNELPKDKLGKQLKSFTEWIRSMKKLPQTALEEKLMDAGKGETIEALAADSIEGKEILTETMADVLLKQGNKAKATEVFRKLSLAYPDKSAYFATRIEQINNRS
ncbi:hypothetical protein [Flavihumibacter sp. CACIAM 22H1]|uniref:hypothetical protein n=1 Tax=Flavihumibacter sp. CACIAM 22H1 TaxID=1812911 RepID=UPI0007A8B38E|nr:hypothetical protein [Flavihumibacter sp. CACIAM 22H1]KYP14483.1 MAG: hypothetical protein A1D16_21175 [Flavihumibacter sp. CACIAM 22H1]